MSQAQSETELKPELDEQTPLPLTLGKTFLEKKLETKAKKAKKIINLKLTIPQKILNPPEQDFQEKSDTPSENSLSRDIFPKTNKCTDFTIHEHSCFCQTMFLLTKTAGGRTMPNNNGFLRKHRMM